MAPLHALRLAIVHVVGVEVPPSGSCGGGAVSAAQPTGVHRLIFIQRFAYRQIMYWVVVKSFAAAIRGHVVGWGKIERKATVELETIEAGHSA